MSLFGMTKESVNETKKVAESQGRFIRLTNKGDSMKVVFLGAAPRNGTRTFPPGKFSDVPQVKQLSAINVYVVDLDVIKIWQVGPAYMSEVMEAVLDAGQARTYTVKRTGNSRDTGYQAIPGAELTPEMIRKIEAHELHDLSLAFDKDGVAPDEDAPF